MHFIFHQKCGQLRAIFTFFAVLIAVSAAVAPVFVYLPRHCEFAGVNLIKGWVTYEQL